MNWDTMTEEDENRIVQKWKDSIKPCTWTETEDGPWDAACPPVGEHSFYFECEGPVENGFKFCPYCGKPLVAVAFKPEPEFDMGDHADHP